LIVKIVGHRRVNLLLKDGRVRTLPGVLHIPDLAKILIFVSKVSDAGVNTVLKKGKCKMVCGAMVLMRGVWYGNLYKLLGSTSIDGCNKSIVLEDRKEEDKVPAISGENIMPWHKKFGHIGEKGL